MIKTAVVLAGGKGSRLRPLTETLPKPLAPLGNKPILEHMLYLFEISGIDRVIIVVNYLGDKIREFIRRIEGRYHLDIDVPSVRPLDTADAVRRCAELIDEDFFVAMGDILTNMDLQEFGKFHRRSGGMATIALKEVDNPLEYGVVVLDDRYRVELFVEKPLSTELYIMLLAYCKARSKIIHGNFINTGFYALSYEVLDILLDNPNLMDWGRHVFPFLLESGYDIYGWNIGEAYWMDVGNPRSYLQANFDLLDEEVLPLRPSGVKRDGIWVNAFSIPESASITPPVVIGDDVEIGADTEIGPYAIIGDSCFVGRSAKVERSVIWNDVRIGEKAVVRKSIVPRASQLGNSCVVEEAVLGEGVIVENYVNVPKGSRVRAGEHLYAPKLVEVKVE